MPVAVALFVRDYALRYPEQVVGLVFVDASVPSREEHAQVRQQHSRSNTSPESRLEDVFFAAGLHRLFGACPGSFPGFRLHLTMPRLEGVCREHLAAFRGEQENFDLSAREAAALSATGLPTSVLSRWTMDPFWNRKQEGLMALSTHSRRVVAAHSGHYLQVDRPALLEEQICLFLKQIRGTPRTVQSVLN